MKEKLFRKQKNENVTIGKAKQHFCKFLKWIYKNLGILICISTTYWISVNFIGNIACSYSNEKYEHIEQSLNTNILEDIGIDALNLQKEVDSCSSSYVSNKGNKSTEIQASIHNSFFNYFNPVVTANLSENYHIISMDRNFNSLSHYMGSFYIIFYLFSIVSGWFLHLLLEKFLYFIRYIYHKFTEKSSTHNSEQVIQ